MRPIVALVLVAALAPFGNACPWVRRSCHPCPVVYFQPCYPPPVYYVPCPPVRVIRVVEVPAPAPVPAVAPAEPAPAPVAKEGVAPDGWCHLRGRIVFDGNPIPKQQPIPNSQGALTEDWVVDPDTRGVQNVIVWLAPEPTAEQWTALKASGKARLRFFPSFPSTAVYPGLARKVKDVEILIPEAPITFIPHVAAVRSGSDIVVRNVSTRFEAVNWTATDNAVGSPHAPSDGKEFRLRNTKLERLPILIESPIYPWMRAYVKVFDHPYFAVTAPDGSFEIKYAPTGNLRLFVWQETTGYRNGAEGRFGEAVKVPSGRLDLGEVKIKPAR